MAFLYHNPEDVRNHILQEYGPDAHPAMFGRRDEFQQDLLTKDGVDLLQWLGKGKIPEVQEDPRRLEYVDSTAILCFGADYDLFRQQWPTSLQSDLDAFYGPFRCNTFLPDSPVSDEFNCALLKAIGVQYIYNPTQCHTLYRLGCQNPFIALFAELATGKGLHPYMVRQKISDLLSDGDGRDLLCRYDAMHQELRTAYFYSSSSRKHLLVTNRW